MNTATTKLIELCKELEEKILFNDGSWEKLNQIFNYIIPKYQS